MNHEGMLLLARHNRWANDRLRAVLDGAPREALERKVSPSHDSVLGLATHAILSQRMFFAEFQGQQFDFETELKATYDDLVPAWPALDDALVDWFAAVDPGVIAGDITRDFGEYGTFTYPMWQEMLQFFHHAIQHRSEIGLILAQVGHPVPDMDLLGLMAEDWGQAYDG